MTVKKSPGRILVVDDEPENIWPLIKYLENEFDILCATSGEQALELAFSLKKPDLILLDVTMPDMDGYEVCARLKAEKSTRDIPVIFLTAKKNEVAETKGFDLGAQDYITKPCSLPKVQARVRSLFNLKREMDRRLLLKAQLEELNNRLEAQVSEKMEELAQVRETLNVYEEKFRYLFKEKSFGNGKKRILAVDDNPDNIHILINCLQSQYEVLCASSGEVALEIVYSEKPPDLILLDIMMPGMDGFEVCSRLKANADTWDIPVIFVTAMGQEIDETKGLSYGAVDFITKPFSFPILEARIKAAIHLKEEMDQRIMLTKKLDGLNRDLESQVKQKTLALQRAYDDLRHSEQNYRDIFENAPAGIFQSTLDKGFLSVNPAMALILGYASPKDLIEHITDIQKQLYVYPDERDVLKDLLDRKKAVVNHEIQLYRRDKKIVWASISARIVKDRAGISTYLEGFLTDITEKKLLEERLQQTAKIEAIGNLVGGIAHDFNNMMTPVIGFSELLLSELSSDDPARKFIEVIKKSGESAAALTRRLLAFSRKQVIQPQMLDLNSAITGIQKMLKPMIGEDIELNILPGKDLCRILADPSQVEQVLMNLTVNARDAMPQGGKLIIETANVHLDSLCKEENIEVPPGDYVMVAVSDTGIGMDEHTAAHIFEPFFTTKAIGKGTGLGLATVYGIVKQCRGSVWAHSELGKGTTFKIYFPAAAKEEVSQIPQPEIIEECSGTESIMVVEDDAGVCELAVTILSQHGYTVLAANSGEQCLARLADYPGPLHLLLTDVVMPDMNGKDLHEKTANRYPGLKVMYMSGYTNNIITNHGVLEQGVKFIQKPFGVKELASKVRDVLDG